MKIFFLYARFKLYYSHNPAYFLYIAVSFFMFNVGIKPTGQIGLNSRFHCIMSLIMLMLRFK